jgi:ornithine--oxo-acid transaminase
VELFLYKDVKISQKLNRYPYFRGKQFQEGIYPVSAVLANNAIMNVNKPGQHGSTFWWKSASAVAVAALEVVREENLSVNAERLGIILRKD